VIFLKVNIKNKTENILLSRIEVVGEATFDKSATPSEDQVKQALSKELGVEKGLIVIKSIDTIFGDTCAKILAYQYLSKDEIKRIEPRNKKKEEAEKKKAEEAKKKATEKKAAPAPEKKEEKPGEKKEEKPAEVKKEAEKKPKEKKEEKAEEKKEEPKKEEEKK
jgi:ribosomal protein S24E